MSWNQVQVVQPNNTNAYGTTPFQTGGKQADAFVSELHGKYYQGSYANMGYRAIVTAATIPAVTSAVAGKFAFVNPVGSGVNAEILSTNMQFVVALNALNGFAWYWTNIGTNVPTSPTAITAVSNRIGAAFTPTCTAYSALTVAATITPVIADLVASVEWITGNTSTNAYTIEKLHDGKMIIPPGIGIWLLGTTAAGPTSGVNAQIDWIEWPL